MAYFNGYPVTYQQYYQNIPAAQQNNSQGGQPIWIQGEQAAKSYLVAPNNTVVLFDSESQTIYLKSADASGMPSIKILDYTVRETAKNGQNSPASVSQDNISGFATKTEIEAITSEIASLRKRIEKMEDEA